MEKIVYVLWGRDAEPIESQRARLLEQTAPAILGAGARGLTLQIADLRGEIGGHGYKLMGEGKSLAAAVSLWLDSYDDRGAAESALAAASSRLAGWLVTESVPQACSDRDWADGTRSPGVTHFTAFPKPDRVSDDEFYAAWHQGHTPLSFQLHPRRWQYVRNAVVRSIVPGSPPWRAIVEERFRTLEDYLDPNRFFGSPDLVQRTLEDVQRFADLDQMHSVPTSEWIIKSLEVRP